MKHRTSTAPEEDSNACSGPSRHLGMPALCGATAIVKPLLFCALVCGVAFGQRSGPRRSVDNSGRRLITRDTERAINRGLKWLAGEQGKDGSFGSRGGYNQNVGVTSLAGMAFLSSGSTPGRGLYGNNVSRALDFVLSQAQPGGYVTSPEKNRSHGPMYGHGFATLFMAECYGMSQRKDLRLKLSRAVRLIIDSQNDDGGWRYSPRSRDADISVTVCQMMALRAARNAGIAVPRETISRAVAYVRKCQNDDGGFRYQLESARESLFPRSAAAVVGLYSAGIYSGPEFDSGIPYLRRYQPRGPRRFRLNYFYGHYYAVQAMWHTGEPHWTEWYTAVRSQITQLQDFSGAWKDTEPQIGSTYATAMACLILQMPNNYLPIFQR